jgi:hypothetical protein
MSKNSSEILYKKFESRAQQLTSQPKVAPLDFLNLCNIFGQYIESGTSDYKNRNSMLIVLASCGKRANTVKDVQLDSLVSSFALAEEDRFAFDLRNPEELRTWQNLKGIISQLCRRYSSDG